jgi:hypothetical protein
MELNKETSEREILGVKSCEGRTDLVPGVRYLTTNCSPARQGYGGEARTFQVASHLLDMGYSVEWTYELMAQYWNGLCQPPWERTELRELVSKVAAYRPA